MKNNKFRFEERQLAQGLRQRVFEMSKISEAPSKITKMTDMELISETVKEEKPYVSPIFTMSEDEILAFVEEFDVRELATLSVAELNKIGEVLGVDPEILMGMEDA